MLTYHLLGESGKRARRTKMTAIRKAEDDDSSDRDPGSFSRGQPQYASFHSGYRLEAYLRAGKSEPVGFLHSSAALGPRCSLRTNLMTG